jgi:hypothetical protein
MRRCITAELIRPMAVRRCLLLPLTPALPFTNADALRATQWRRIRDPSLAGRALDGKSRDV